MQLIRALASPNLHSMVANAKLEIAARLDEVFLERGFNRGHGRIQAIATQHKVSRETVRKWLEGESIPKVSRLAEIVQGTSWTVDQVLTGRTVDFNGVREGYSAPYGSVDFKRQSSQQTAIEKIRQRRLELSPASQRILARIAQAEHDGKLTKETARLIDQLLDKLLQ